MRALTLAECRAHAAQITALALVTAAALTVAVCGSQDGTGLRTEGKAEHGQGWQTVVVDPIRPALVSAEVRQGDR
ncbi:hypothetical protein ACI2L4_06395 [Streptomyces sparsogenes]|uniref:hypothetical protein n=1 Tax=Streptomyces sparsogenes TaxID=67365 RepID=UPI003403F396